MQNSKHSSDWAPFGVLAGLIIIVLAIMIYVRDSSNADKAWVVVVGVLGTTLAYYAVGGLICMQAVDNAHKRLRENRFGLASGIMLLPLFIGSIAASNPQSKLLFELARNLMMGELLVWLQLIRWFNVSHSEENQTH